MTLSARACGTARLAASTRSLVAGLGSTSIVADTSGNQYGKDLYEPWGPIRYTSGTIPANRTFTGELQDGALASLHHFGARWYAQEIGRFLSPDSIVPSGNPQALNRYSYALNAPTRYTDPTGHNPCNDPSCAEAAVEEAYGSTPCYWCAITNSEEFQQLAEVAQWLGYLAPVGMALVGGDVGPASEEFGPAADKVSSSLEGGIESASGTALAQFSGLATGEQFATTAEANSMTAVGSPYTIPKGPYSGTLIDQYIYTSEDEQVQWRLKEAEPGCGNTGWQARVTRVVQPGDPNFDLAAPPNR